MPDRVEPRRYDIRPECGEASERTRRNDKSHVLFKDESKYALDKEYRQAMSQLTTYSMVGKNKHDDVPDALAMFVDWQMSDRANIATIMKRPF